VPNAGGEVREGHRGIPGGRRRHRRRRTGRPVGSASSTGPVERIRARSMTFPTDRLETAPGATSLPQRPTTPTSWAPAVPRPPIGVSHDRRMTRPLDESLRPLVLQTNARFFATPFSCSRRSRRPGKQRSRVREPRTTILEASRSRLEAQTEVSRSGNMQ